MPRLGWVLTTSSCLLSHWARIVLKKKIKIEPFALWTNLYSSLTQIHRAPMRGRRGDSAARKSKGSNVHGCAAVSPSGTWNARLSLGLVDGSTAGAQNPATGMAAMSGPHRWPGLTECGLHPGSRLRGSIRIEDLGWGNSRLDEVDNGRSGSRSSSRLAFSASLSFPSFARFPHHPKLSAKCRTEASASLAALSTLVQRPPGDRRDTGEASRRRAPVNTQAGLGLCYLTRLW